MSHVLSGVYNLKEAAKRLKIGYRQVLRVKKRYEALGAKGLIHQRRGQPSNRAYPDTFKVAVLERYQAQYDGFGPTFASEKLAELGLPVNRETLRRWLIEAGLWQRGHKKKHRQRRARRERFGELVQIDGSIHPWFGDERYTCLLNAVDDATSTTYAIMASGETTAGVFELLKGWIARYGIPQAVYVDLKNVYVGGSQGESAFIELCDRLGIEIVRAYSPQAKGRVERSHQVYQDRLVKEIRLQGLTKISEVNALLREGFVEGLNERFAKLPGAPESGHAPWASGKSFDEVFYVASTRQLQNDWTISYQNRCYQAEGNAGLRPKSRVEVRDYLDGRLGLFYKGSELSYKALEARPVKQEKKKRLKERRSVKPAADHPWRQCKDKSVRMAV